MTTPLTLLDRTINKLTMYKILTGGLTTLLLLATLLAAIHRLPQQPVTILVNAALLGVVCLIANRALGVVFNANLNNDSWAITALILTFIIPPTSLSAHRLFLVALAGLIAMASKYLLVFRKHHLFNPAAVSVLILGLAGLLPATWWVGSPIMALPVALYGLVVLRKIRKFQLFGSFIIAGLLTAVIVGHTNTQGLGDSLRTALLSSPLLFFGTIMLTEPETMPGRLWQQLVFGAIAGVLLNLQFKIGILSATPELALIVANIYASLIDPKRTVVGRLKTKTELVPGTHEFVFSTDRPMNFMPGQYVTINLQHKKTDFRGSRRSFSVASAPGMNEITIAFKVPASGKVSSFKQRLLALSSGDSVSITSVTGNFVLPTNTDQKLVFMAGGIGITPFLSMIRHLTTQEQTRSVTLLYFVANEAENCFARIFSAAHKYGVQVIPVYPHGTPKTVGSLSGRLTGEDITKALPDYQSRQFYLSGPPGFVDAYKKVLLASSVHRRAIKTDHFSGY